jgi:hypothetical protein
MLSQFSGKTYMIRSSAPPAVVASLSRALDASHSAHAGAPLERLRDKGLAHDHVRLAGSGLLARIPKQSQLQLAAQANLDYQAACFRRAATGGHAPRLAEVLPPSMHLPRGALLVEEINGRVAALPQDLPAIVRALAALHALPLPPDAQRAPLLNAADPLSAVMAEVGEQARHLEQAGVGTSVQSRIDEELERLRLACLQDARPPRHLIAFDGHPGNFIVRPDGTAVLVDLEKCRYSYPGLDLAHATLYTSTTWDVDSCAELEIGDVISAYAEWERAIGPDAAGACRPWHVPLRRAMWLWSITWCAKWRAVSSRVSERMADGEDWSAERSDAALVSHVRGRVDHYLDAAIVQRVLAEFDALDLAFA